MTKYPFLIYNVTGEFMLTKTFHINPDPDEGRKVGIIVETEAEIYDENGVLTDRARSEFERFDFGEQLKTNMKVGLVCGPSDCSYFNDNGEVIRSDFVPNLERNLLKEEPDEEMFRKMKEFVYDKVIRPQREAQGPLRVQRRPKVIL